MRRIIALLTIIVVTAVALIGCFRHVTRFTDSTGVQWRVLALDLKGNRLIITEHVQGVAQYNSTNVYTPLGQSDVLRPVLDAWFSATLAPELREVALPAENVNNDVRLAPGEEFAFIETAGLENGPAGWTRAGIGTPTPEKALFILSMSEVNKYGSIGLGTINSLGTLNVRATSYCVYFGVYRTTPWWLRSPGTSLHPVAFVHTDTEPMICRLDATIGLGFRPALWVSR